MKLCVVAIAITFGCKKEEISNTSIIGKWEFREVACYSKISSYHNPTWSFDTPIDYSKVLEDFGLIHLEIKKGGEFLFSSNIGTEKFHVVSTNSLSLNESYVFHNGFQDLMEGAKYCLKSKTGETFYFSLFYRNDIDQLITVPWIKGQSYYSRDKPNFATQELNAIILGHQGSTGGLGREYLGLFKRLD